VNAWQGEKFGDDTEVPNWIKGLGVVGAVAGQDEAILWLGRGSFTNNDGTSCNGKGCAGPVRTISLMP
jgi:hypothetical protein